MYWLVRPEAAFGCSPDRWALGTVRLVCVSRVSAHYRFAYYAEACEVPDTAGATRSNPVSPTIEKAGLTLGNPLV
jgi:hypothetical protein